MLIKIERIETVMITNKREVLESHEFDNWQSAFVYLEKQLNLELDDTTKNEFIANENTFTNPRSEMVNKGDAVYSANVFYNVDVYG